MYVADQCPNGLNLIRISTRVELIWKMPTIQLLEQFQHNEVSFNGTLIYMVSMLTMVSVKQIYFIRTPPKIYGTKAIYRYVN